MDIEAYLERINYWGTLAPTAANLRDLQAAHLRTVPFENLSIHAGEPIVLEDGALFTKIVEDERGGFCYELNGLFAALLGALGFKVAMLSAEVANAEGEFSEKFDHMTLLVSLPDSDTQRWLVDVGFGDSFLEPLLLDERSEQVQGSRSYRIDAEDSHLIMLQREAGEEWKAQYRFTLQPYAYGDYAERCQYQQTSPESHFTQARICSRTTEDGRVTLSGMRLITTKKSSAGEVREEQTLTSEDEYTAVLREQFGIAMKRSKS